MTALTVQQAAEQLGVCRETVYTWLDNGTLGCFRRGKGYIRIRPEHIQAFCEAHECPRKAEPPRLKKLPGRRKFYIIDGPEKLSTGCEDEAQTRQALANYVNAKGAVEDGATVGELLDARLRQLRQDGKARADVARWLVPRLKRAFGDLYPHQIDRPIIE
ncbi:helix-turn-helix domain-containing protein [Algihabitans albus]|uniref:helix-turn-helix domain-containing protein n=1 Tax=Algihabitans albus TaxID=2164067 RepID=UPI0035D08DD8